MIGLMLYTMALHIDAKLLIMHRFETQDDFLFELVGFLMYDKGIYVSLYSFYVNFYFCRNIWILKLKPTMFQ